MYGLGYYIGYFSIMIVLLVIAIIRSKKRNSWGWFIAAAVIQLIAFLGRATEDNLVGNTDSRFLDWIIYIVLLVISAIFICIRSKKSKENNNESTDYLN